ncbi:MAG: hypothetical protein ABIR47_03910 [Candidatus Kapaibacterium sp.]
MKKEELQLARWKQARKMGRKEYALKLGVLVYGPVVAIPWAITMMVLEKLWDGLPMTLERLGAKIAAGFLFFGILGYFTRLRRWDSLMRRFGKGDATPSGSAGA